MIELVAKRPSLKTAVLSGVIAAVMTKDRAHMHLDTVFTLLDRDIALPSPRWYNIRAISLPPWQEKAATST